jgi:hypothetical protein
MDRDKIYLGKKHNDIKVIKTEILFTPLLIFLPIIVAGFLINDWYYRGFSMGDAAYDGELIIGVIILIGNIIFDVPFVKSLLSFRRK